MEKNEIIHFAVQSKYFSALEAYRKELDRIGMVYNDFNEFTEECWKSSCDSPSPSQYRRLCISTNFGGRSLNEKFEYSLIITGPATKTFSLDTEFSEAVEYAEATMEKFKKSLCGRLVRLNSEYEAVVFNDRINVGCQTIEKSAFLNLVKAAKETGLMDS